MAAKMANWLVGNPLDGPVLEITLWGPRVAIEGHCQMALTGGDLVPKLDGREIPLYKTVEVRRSELTFGPVRSGCRAYLSVAGAWEVSRWLGSCSAAATMAAQLTPDSVFDAGSTLTVHARTPSTPRSLRQHLFQAHAHRGEPFRILAGPEFDLLSSAALDCFFNQAHQVSPKSNRMGCRLETQLPLHQLKTELISSGVTPGTVQVMSSGQPVILMADAQTTGGYPRLGHVITADLDRLGQVPPAAEIRFALVDEAQAVAALRRQTELEQEALG